MANFKSVLLLDGKTEFSKNHTTLNIEKILENFINASVEHLNVTNDVIDLYIYVSGAKTLELAENLIEYQNVCNIKFLIPFASYDKLIFNKTIKFRYQQLMKNNNTFILNEVIPYDFFVNKNLQSSQMRKVIKNIMLNNFRVLNANYDFIYVLGENESLTRNLISTSNKEIANYDLGYETTELNLDDFF